MKKAFVALAVALSICTFSGCVSTPEKPVIVDRVPISFIPTTDVTAARQKVDTMVMNYVTCLVSGDYQTALQYVSIPEGVLFDANALQTAVLADGFGRGESATFYGVTDGEEVTDGNKTVVINQGEVASVEYDLTLSGTTSTVTKSIPLTKTDSGYCVDMSDHIVEGQLKFRVPKYVDVFINGAEVPKSFMDANFTYTIDAGVPKLGEDELNLTLKSNFGVEQTYPLVFLGKGSKSKNSVNDQYYYSRDDISVFYLDVPRELRESALEYISSKVFPKLTNDLVKGTSWDVASIKSEFGELSNIDGMFPDYYKTASNFTNMTTKEGGLFVFYDVSCHDFVCTDELAERKSSRNTISDFNVVDLYVSFDYNFLYTKGAQATERDSRGSIDCLVSLSWDKDGNWYVNDLSDRAFRLNVE